MRSSHTLCGLVSVPRYATWRKKTPGAVCLRKIMSKFNAHDESLCSSHWGLFYRGHSTDVALSVSEQTKRNQIKSGAMPKAKSTAVMRSLDSRRPLTSRTELIEALAALAAEFPEDMSRKVTGANKRIDEILWCAADPDRLEWLMNNLRWRHSVSSRLRLCTLCRITNEECACHQINAIPSKRHSLRPTSAGVAAFRNQLKRGLARRSQVLVRSNAADAPEHLAAEAGYSDVSQNAASWCSKSRSNSETAI